MYPTPPPAYPTPPAPPRSGRTGAVVLMAVGTVLYVLSLAPWVMLLIGSVFLFDSPSNTGVAYLVILGLLGWPVFVLAGLIVGWWKRTVKVALIALALPLVWVLVMAGTIEATTPEFLNLRDFLPAPVVVKPAEATLAGMTLNKTTRDEVSALLGKPEQTEPSDAETTKAWRWEYPSKGVRVEFSNDVVTGIAVTAGFPGETARALRIGDPMARARELYGDTEPTGTHYGDGGARSYTYSYNGKWYNLKIRTDEQDRVKEVEVSVNP